MRYPVRLPPLFPSTRSFAMFGPFSLSSIRRRPSSSLRHRPKAAAARQCRPRLESLETRDLLSGTAANEAVAQAYGQLPLSFEVNEGQTDAQVRFLARGQGYGLFLTPTEAVLGLR